MPACRARTARPRTSSPCRRRPSPARSPSPCTPFTPSRARPHSSLLPRQLWRGSSCVPERGPGGAAGPGPTHHDEDAAGLGGGRGPEIPSRSSWTVSKPVRHLPSPSSIHNIHIPTEPAAPGVSGRERRLRHFYALCGPRDWPSPDRLCCPRAPLAEISPTRISATVLPVSRPCQRSPCRGGRARTSTDASSRSLSPVSSVGGAQDSDTVFFLGPPRPRAPPPALAHEDLGPAP